MGSTCPGDHGYLARRCAIGAQSLDIFALERMGDYHTNRDFPAIEGTSSSPYAASGMLSAGQCLQAALSVNQGEIDTGRRRDDLDQ